ncbi:MAG: Rrf2 family transcriptional regulator [Acidobacteriota bacterium]|nr:Rrf2 family transcriptional regulator [Acidobacteriota bacterium]
MKISTKGEYGIRAMLYLAAHAPDQPVTSHEIARHQGIPEPYLRQILALLAKDGLVVSHRGPQGGHSLGRGAGEINLRDILLVLEGQLTSVDQILALPCTIDVGTEHCVLREVFLDVKRAVEGILVGTSLEDLVTRQEEILARDICVPQDLPPEGAGEEAQEEERLPILRG